MTFSFHENKVGPFAEAKSTADNFCHNLFLTYTLNECALRLIELQEEYEEAVASEDSKLVEQKLYELQTYESSMVLTACIFEESDNISM